VKKAAEASIAQFEIAMNDDLNTPRACAALFTFLKKTEKGEISKGDAALALEVADKFDKVRPFLLSLLASFHSSSGTLGVVLFMGVLVPDIIGVASYLPRLHSKVLHGLRRNSLIPLASRPSFFSLEEEDCLCARASLSVTFAAYLSPLLFHGVCADSCVFCLISKR
jgi:hypothetical protein